MRAKREAGKGGRSLHSLRGAQRGRTLFHRAGLPCAFPPPRRKNEVKQLKLSFYTLGCKVNQNETGALAELFCQNGFSLAREGEAADVYLVNSWHRHRRGATKKAASGCGAQSACTPAP